MRRVQSLLFVSALLSIQGCVVEDEPEVGQTDDEALVNFVICHDVPDDANPPQTISVGLLALTFHLGHGDALGACPVTCAAEGATCSVASDCCLGACQAGRCVTVCQPNSAAGCYPGPAGTQDVGECGPGTQTCDARGAGYGACTGAVTPVPDACGDDLDNDCDGAADDGCCVPAPEACDGVDNDCDGAVDDGCCSPAFEACDGVDNDCDGVVDDGCVGGWAWGDFDADGIQSDAYTDPDGNHIPAEEGLSDIMFVLRTADGTAVATTTSDADGYYAFAGVPTFTSLFVEVVPPNVFMPTTPQAGADPAVDSDFGDNHRTVDFTLDGDDSLDADCGLRSAI